ncbi:hypothetical protein ANN_17057 [Periplaneta americana]|uniref:Uncharacterized protein n=1 Tax=Periplaneta americana TaxID=6978 RepID=A0ABQ8ST72_PERAM|nr:hypothetical protein ANN_17057 [Periplaneta americana]
MPCPSQTSGFNVPNYLSVALISAIMVLSPEEKVFIVDHYFRPHGVGRQNRQSLHHVKEQDQERFNIAEPNNTAMSAVAEKFRLSVTEYLIGMVPQHFGRIPVPLRSRRDDYNDDYDDDDDVLMVAVITFMKKGEERYRICSYRSSIFLIDELTKTRYEKPEIP